MLGQIRLQWWREAIDVAYAGGTPRPHVVVEAITAAIRSRHLTRQHFDRLIDARERDLDDAPPATLATLEDYAEGTSARLVLLALEALQAATPAACEAGRHVGIAYALTGLMRALPVHAAAGRTFIPAGIAADAGLDPADYAALRSTPALTRAVAAIAAAATRHLAAARTRRRDIPAAALPALLTARIAADALRRLERSGFDPFTGTAAMVDPLQSWRLAYARLVGRF
jgi:phytoene synthase